MSFSHPADTCDPHQVVESGLNSSPKYLEYLRDVSQIKEVVHLARSRQQLSYDVVEHVDSRNQHGFA